MDENNPEKSSINGAKINLFCNSGSYNNVSELNIKKTETDLKLENTAIIAKGISEPSTSQKPVCIKNKYPIRKQKKGKFKIISIVHIPKSIDNKIRNDKKNRYIPLILKKSNKSKLKSKNQKAISNLANSIPGNCVRDNPIVINSAIREALNISKQLNQLRDIQKSSNGNELLISKELVIPVVNSGKMESKNLGKVIPFDISRQVQNYFTNSNIQTRKYTNLKKDSFVNVSENQYFCCPMPQKPVQALSTNKMFGSVVTIQGPIVEINPNGNDSNISDISTSNASSSGIESTSNSDDQSVNSVQKNVQLPKLLKINRLVSILKSNQPYVSSTNGKNLQGIETDSSTEMETETEVETSFISGSSVTPKSDLSFLSKSLSSEKLTTSYESEKSLIVTEESSLENSLSVDGTVSFESVSETTSGTEALSPKNETTFESEITSPEIKATFGTEIASPEIDSAFESKIDSPEIKTTLETEAAPPETEMDSPETKATFEIAIETTSENKPVSPKLEVFKAEASSLSEMKGTFETKAALPKIESKVDSVEIDSTLRNKKVCFNDTEAEGILCDSNANSSNIDTEIKSKANTSELVTVASDDIPYNAEVEIDSNSNSDGNAEENDTPLKKNCYSKMEENIDDLDFDVLKEKNKRRLFLEREDVEFCRAAQRKVKGIRHYGFRGFSAISKFNEILNLIPDESPATIHALMVACKNKVDPVLDHLRYIQETREILRNQRNYSSSSSSIIETPCSSAQLQQSKAKPFIAAEVEAKAKTNVRTPNTRKKKISYDVDLSDNYPDDSDEDYFPGKDLTPRKKKRCKRRYFSGKSKISPSPFEECRIHKTPIRTELLLNNKNEEASTSTSEKQQQQHHPISSLNQCPESGDEKRVIPYGKTGSPHSRKRHVVELLKKNDAVYKAEPVQREILELAKFKKKRNPNSHVVPPLQKFMYTHEGVENFRYMTLTKQ